MGKFPVIYCQSGLILALVVFATSVACAVDAELPGGVVPQPTVVGPANTVTGNAGGTAIASGGELAVKAGRFSVNNLSVALGGSLRIQQVPYFPAAPTANPSQLLPGATTTVTVDRVQWYAGEANISYEWSKAPGSSAGTVTFTPNGNHDAVTPTVSFSLPGTYYLQVTANAGNGVVNSYQVATPVVVGKLSQTITFAPIDPQTYGVAPFTVNATASSGLAVTLAVQSGPAMLSGNQLTITGAGSVTVTANQAGDATYDPAPQVSRTFEVTPATLSVTGTNAARTYGVANPSPLAYTVTGFVNGDQPGIVTGTPTLGASATTTSPVGPYDITVATTGMSAPNYTIVGVPGVLTVTPATLQITADDKSAVYGDASLPALTWTPSGFQNGENQSVITGSPGLATSVTPLSAVGIYEITTSVAGLLAQNYTFTGVNGSLQVTKAPLTVTADDQSRPYNSANPTFTWTVTGYRNGQDGSVITGVPELATSAVPSSPVGTYPITVAVGNLSATNYSFAGQGGTLTVVKAAQTITFAALPEKTIGDPAFTLMATSSSGLPVSYGSSATQVATIDGAVVTLVAPGVTTITASQAGDGNYLPATPQQQGLTVNAAIKQDQTITFNLISSAVLGDPPLALTASASSGLGVSYASSDEQIAYISGNTVVLLASGTVQITASQGGNYAYNPAIPVSRTLQIDPPPTPSAPQFSPPGGTYADTIDVTLSTVPAMATIYYTIDGSEPTTASLVYSDPITVDRGTVVRAFAVNQVGSSGTSSQTYTIKVAKLVLTPPFAVFSTSVDIVATTATSGATLRYTTTGETPTAESQTLPVPLTISDSTNVKIIATRDGCEPSAVALGVYTKTAAGKPHLDPPAGVYLGSVSIAMQSVPEGGEVWYTTGPLNGPVDTPEPGTGSAVLYQTPLLLTAGTTVKAVTRVGSGVGAQVSAVHTANYTIVPTTTYAISGGGQVLESEVSPACLEGTGATAGARIFASVVRNGQTESSSPVTITGENSYFANLSLVDDETVTAQFTIMDLSGQAHATTRQMRWKVTSLTTPDTGTLVIRAGDSVQFSAGADGMSQVTINPGTRGDGFKGVTTTAGNPVRATYSEPGTYFASAWTNGDMIGSRTVKVVRVDFPHQGVAAEVDTQRSYVVPVKPGLAADLVHFSSADTSVLTVSSVAGGTSAGGSDHATLTIMPKKRGFPCIVARIGTETGPIIAWKEVAEFELDLVYAYRTEIDPNVSPAARDITYAVTMRPHIPWLIRSSTPAVLVDTYTGETISCTTGNQTVAGSANPPQPTVEKPEFSERQADGETEIRVTGTGDIEDNIYAISLSVGATFTSITADAGGDITGDNGLDWNLPAVPFSIELTPYNKAIASGIMYTRPIDAIDWDDSGNLGSLGDIRYLDSYYSGTTYPPAVGPFLIDGNSSTFSFTSHPAYPFEGGLGRMCYWSVQYFVGGSRATESSPVVLAGAYQAYDTTYPPFFDENGQETYNTYATSLTLNGTVSIPSGDIRDPDGPPTLTVIAGPDGLGDITATIAGCAYPQFCQLNIGPISRSFSKNPQTVRLPPGEYTVGTSLRPQPPETGWDYKHYSAKVKVIGTAVSITPGRFGYAGYSTSLYNDSWYTGTSDEDIPEFNIVVGGGAGVLPWNAIPIFVQSSSSPVPQIQVERSNLRVNLSYSGTSVDPVFAEGQTSATLDAEKLDDFYYQVGWDPPSLYTTTSPRNESVDFIFKVGSAKKAIVHWHGVGIETGTPRMADYGAIFYGLHGSVVNGTGNLLWTSNVKTWPGMEWAPQATLVYNSKNGFSRNFGTGWQSNYDMRILGSLRPPQNYEFAIQGSLRWLVDGDGKPIRLDSVGMVVSEDGGRIENLRADAPNYSGLIEVQLRHRYSLVAEGDWQSGEKARMTRDDNRIYYFNEAGFLSRISDLAGKRSITIKNNDQGAVSAHSDRALEVDLIAEIGVGDEQVALSDFESSQSGKWSFEYQDSLLWKATLIGTMQGKSGQFSFIDGGSSQTWEYQYEESTDQDHPEAFKSVSLGLVDGEDAKVSVDYPNLQSRRITYPFGASETISDGRLGSDGIKTFVRTATENGEPIIRWWRSVALDSQQRYHYRVAVIGPNNRIRETRSYSTDSEYQSTEYVWKKLATSDGTVVDGSSVMAEVISRAVTGLDDVDAGDIRQSFTHYSGEGALVGSLQSKSGPAAESTTIKMTPQGDLDAVLVGAERTWKVIERNSLGTPTKVKSPENHEQMYSVHEDSQITLGGTDRFNFNQRTEVDSLLRPIIATHPGGVVSESSYDPLGRLTRDRDAMGRETIRIYDRLGRLRGIERTASGADAGTTTAPVENEAIAYTPEGNGQMLVIHTRGSLVLSKKRYDGAGRLKDEIVPRSLVDGASGITETTTTYVYKQDSGFLDKIRDARQNEWIFSFDSDGRLLSTRTPLGQETAQTYNGLGWLLTRTDVDGGKTRWTYDRAGRQVRTINALGGWTESGYDDAGALTRRGTSAGGKETVRPDKDGTIQSWTDVHQNVMTSLWEAIDGGARQTIERSGDEGTSRKLWLNAKRMLTSSITEFNEVDYETTVERRDDGSIRTISQPGMNLQTMLQDGHGREVEQKLDPVDGFVLRATSSYDSATGMLTASRSPYGLVSETGPDPVSGERNLLKSNPTGSSSQLQDIRQVLERDSNGNITKFAIYPGGNAAPLITQQTFDADNRLETRTEPSNVKTKWVYQGSRISRIERQAAGASVWVPVASYDYDALGHPTRVTRGATDDGSQQISEFTYDTLGALTSETIGSDTTRYVYNPGTRALAKKIHPDGTSTEYISDLRGRLGTVINPRKFQTVCGYDALDRIVTVTKGPAPGAVDPAVVNTPTTTEQFTYWADSQRVKTHTDIAGRVTSFFYDGIGRLVRREIQGVAGIGPGAVLTTIHTRYDDDPQGGTGGYEQTSYIGSEEGPDAGEDYLVRTFDRAGRLSRLSLPGQSPVALTYDAAGRITTRGLTTYTYKATTGQLDEIFETANANRKATFSFDMAGRLGSITLPHTLSRSFTYDGADRLATLTNFLGSTAVESWAHEYDAQGRIAGIRQYGDGAVNPVASTHYAYRTGRLVSEQRVGQAAVSASYGYDPNGNRTSVERYEGLQPRMDDFSDPQTTTLPAQLGNGWNVSSGQLSVGPNGNGPVAELTPLTLASGTDVRGPRVTVTVDPVLPANALTPGTVAAGLQVTIDATTAYRVQWRRQYTTDFSPTPVGQLVVEKLVTDNGTTTSTILGISDPVGEQTGAPVVLSLETGSQNVLTASATIAVLGTIAFDCEADLGPLHAAPPPVSLTVTATGACPAETSFDDLASTTAVSRTVQRQAYDGLDRLLSIDDLDALGVPLSTTSFGRDTLGRMTGRVLTANGNSTTLASYTYDALDRMATFTSGSSTTTYGYMGPEWMRRSASPAGQMGTTWAYDDQGITGQTMGSQNTTFQRHGGSLLWDVADNQVRSYAFDTHGNVSGIAGTMFTDPGGLPVPLFAHRFEYDAWGRLIRERMGQLNGSAPIYTEVTGGFSSGPRYRGMWYDGGAAGLYKTATRFYDPGLGQFLQEDPARAGSNWYAYCGGDPVNRSDPSGLDWRWNGSDWDYEPGTNPFVPYPTFKPTGSEYQGYTYIDANAYVDLRHRQSMFETLREEGTGVLNDYGYGPLFESPYKHWDKIPAADIANAYRTSQPEGAQIITVPSGSENFLNTAGTPLEEAGVILYGRRLSRPNGTLDIGASTTAAHEMALSNFRNEYMKIEIKAAEAKRDRDVRMGIAMIRAKIELFLAVQSSFLPGSGFGTVAKAGFTGLLRGAVNRAEITATVGQFGMTAPEVHAELHASALMQRLPAGERVLVLGGEGEFRGVTNLNIMTEDFLRFGRVGHKVADVTQRIEQGGGVLVVGDATKRLPFTSGFFNQVRGPAFPRELINDELEKEILRVLAPGGRYRVFSGDFRFIREGVKP